MFRKIKSINLPYDKQALVYYTCVNYNSCSDDVQRKIQYLCDKEGGISGELFGLVTSGANVHSRAACSEIGEKRLRHARKSFYENWFDNKEDWKMPRKTKKDFTKRTQELMEKTLDRLEACIDDYDTPIPFNQLTSALGTLYDKGYRGVGGDDGSARVKINIE